MTFQLDTSGAVADVPGPGETAKSVKIRDGKTAWSDLSPFTQGYAEALLREIGATFRMLAPETLARIIADCEAKAAELGCPLTAEDGRVFWRKFMSKVRTVQLGDDAKVRFA